MLNKGCPGWHWSTNSSLSWPQPDGELQNLGKRYLASLSQFALFHVYYSRLSLRVQLCSAPSEKLFLPQPCDADEARAHRSPCRPQQPAPVSLHISPWSARGDLQMGLPPQGHAVKKGPTYLLNGGRGQAPRSSEITRIFRSSNNPGFVFLLSPSE